ncbi:MAG: ABC transporter substrate-binding protein [Clostridiales bacterium]|nr:ABC transporter substrate-binding protein [Candidatus Blautia equi]
MKKLMTMLLSVSLILTMMMGLTMEAHAEETTAVRAGALSGPTAFGLVKLMEDAANSETANTYEFAELSTDPSTFVAPLASGQIDIAAVPANLASVIYNKTEGGIKILAINNLGVLHIVERGETVNSIADLAGKTVYATGAGATPEYTLRHLLNANGIDPDNDLTIQFCADTTEALSYINQDEAAIAMLPQPFVTAAMAQVEGLRAAIDLNDAWAELDNGCDIVTGVIVARSEFVENNPEAVETFLSEYAASMAYAEENVEDNAALIEKYGIVAKAPVAMKAFPGVHLSLKTGEEMKASMSGYLQILFDENPQAVGGALPGDDFYYGM